MLRYISTLLIAALCAVVYARAQSDGFTDLPADRYVIETDVPHFRTQIHTGQPAAGGNFSVSIEYPEYAPLKAAEVRALRKAGFEQTAIEPRVSVGVLRKQAVLNVSFAPFARIDGRWMRLTSCKLTVRRSALAQAAGRSATDRYASSSVLSQGRWVKIRVGSEGLYALTPSFLQSAGFADPARVRLYGYGGLVQEEQLDFDGDDRVTDDLEEVPLYRQGNRLLFYSEGTVRWTWNSSTQSWEHANNTYSSYAYYFLTEADEAPATFSTIEAPDETPSTTVSEVTYPVLLDDDAYSWYTGGREFHDAYDFAYGNTHSFSLDAPGIVEGEDATVRVAFSASNALSSTRAEITLNGTSLGSLTVARLGSDENAREVRTSFNTSAAAASNTFRFTTTAGHAARLNFICINYTRRLDASDGAFSFSPRTGRAVTLSIAGATASTRLWRLGRAGDPVAEVASTLTDGVLTAAVADGNRRYAVVDVEQSCPTPELVGETPNQNLHADAGLDMIIIVPASGLLTEEAERLADEHRQRDNLRVKVVPADEIYNEFSSGTPDATAYRRYLKMLYDRATSDADAPRHLLLFGESLWDNRMLMAENASLSPDDFLLAYETTNQQNSIGPLHSYVTDDYYGLLDDGEGRNMLIEPVDLSIGRLTCRTPEEARVVVDKTIAYMEKASVGTWRNTVCFMGDDIDDHDHMNDANAAYNQVQTTTDGKLIMKRFFWDVYKRTITATGYSYPQMSDELKEQMRRGALMFNYSGHGAPDRISHARLLLTDDFRSIATAGIPLWVFASCEVATFDSGSDNIGRAALLYEDGGAVAVMCASRKVYSDPNRRLNVAFCKHLFETDEAGDHHTMGEALQLAKIELIDNGGDRTNNKLKYHFFGDPALRLGFPTGQAVIDSIGGVGLADGSNVQLSAGSKVRVSGRVLSPAGEELPGFSGVATLTLFDRETTVTCQNNESSDAGPMTYTDRGNALFEGSDSIRGGRFSMEIPVPYDISYSDATGRIYVYAVSNDHSLECHGYDDRFHLNGTAESAEPDTMGPKVFVALDSMDFPNGGKVGRETLLLATISDDNGINTTGNGLGHDLELTIDGDKAGSYILNDYFSYDFGTYRSGSISYQLQDLTDGAHTLELRAWDVNNNSTTAVLSFLVGEQAPTGFAVSASHNPATTGTTFVAHVEAGEADSRVTFEVFDLSGRRLWWREVTAAAGTAYASAAWDLRDAAGRPLEPGIYLFRGVCRSGGDEKETDAQKLIIVRP